MTPSTPPNGAETDVAATDYERLHKQLLHARRTVLHALILALGVPVTHRHAAYIALRRALRHAH